MKFNYVFIHRETAPLGPPIFEWIIAKILRKKIIYDFDDAIWLTDQQGRISNHIRCFWKVAKICNWAYKISCGNRYLANYAKQFNPNVIVNPTTIDTNHHQKSNALHTNSLPVIGWTGSHTTLKYLDPLIPTLKKFEHEFKLIVICNHNPAYNLANYQFITWDTEQEVKALQSIDIGIMPLPNDPWSKGKCGFKALQYMALAKPVVISPVGVNTEIINDQINGFLAASEGEWQKAIKALLLDKKLRVAIGLAGYQTLQNLFSKKSNEANFLSLFD
jgi:glycosyltransferase involved in cell wall biosynthesis